MAHVRDKELWYVLFKNWSESLTSILMPGNDWFLEYLGSWFLGKIFWIHGREGTGITSRDQEIVACLSHHGVSNSKCIAAEKDWATCWEYTF